MYLSSWKSHQLSGLEAAVPSTFVTALTPEGPGILRSAAPSTSGFTNSREEGRNMRVAYCLLTLLALVFLTGASKALAQQPGPPCSLDRLSGDWGFVNTGQIGGADANGTGTLHLNKDGTNSAHLFVNMGGGYFEFDRYGFTTVNPDCTTTGNWNDGGPAYHCVAVDDGNEMWCIYEQTPASFVTLKRIHTRN